MPTGKGSKLLRYIEHRLRVSLADGRTIVGTFLAFDKHLNLVLVDAEEYRNARKSSKGGGSAVVEERVEKSIVNIAITNILVMMHTGLTGRCCSRRVMVMIMIVTIPCEENREDSRRYVEHVAHCKCYVSLLRL